MPQARLAVPGHTEGMKTLLLLSCLLAAAATARASELRVLPGGQPACQFEEQEGCSWGRKVVSETPAASAQSDCFNHEIGIVRVKTKVPASDVAVMIIANMCKAPSTAVTSCVNEALAGARDAGNPVSSDAGLDAIVKMCSAAK